MSDSEIQSKEIAEQAQKIECLLPKLLRRLFTLEHNHPVAELPLAQLRVCMVLFSGPKPMSVLSEELGISVSAITQIADRLEKVDLVERNCEVDDRRTKKLALTARGLELMTSRRETRIERVTKALEHLEPRQREQFVDSLRVMLEVAVLIAPEPPNEDPTGSRVEQ